jgi:predicted TIM-barrel fold metal-dependent hydrolase
MAAPADVAALTDTFVLDVDTHFEVAFTADDHPLRDFATQFPSAERFVAEALARDLILAAPADTRPADADLLLFSPPANRSYTSAAVDPAASVNPHFPSASAAERLAWMDRIGIDAALVNPGVYARVIDYLDADRTTIVRLLNDFLADRLDGHTERLMPVTLLDWTDLDAAESELRRMRARGSRAFWVQAAPVGGVSPAHPSWDRIWSAAEDLGMVAILHIGNAPPVFDGWANAGWTTEGGTGVGGFFRYANSLNHQAAETFITAMLYGGAFGRHPNLTVLTEELQIGWLPFLISRCEGLGSAGPWPFERSPGDMLRHHVRASPLIGVGDRGVLDHWMPQLPGMLVFSSDYPHGEGNAEPISLYGSLLAALDDSVRAQFLGGTMADCFARMGDPLGGPAPQAAASAR